MKKIQKKDKAILIICSVVWLITLIALKYVQDIASMFLAIPHSMAIALMIVVGAKYAPDVKKKRGVTLSKNSSTKVTENDLIFWDISDD